MFSRIKKNQLAGFFHWAAAAMGITLPLLAGIYLSLATVSPEEDVILHFLLGKSLFWILPALFFLALASMLGKRHEPPKLPTLRMLAIGAPLAACAVGTEPENSVFSDVTAQGKDIAVLQRKADAPSLLLATARTKPPARKRAFPC